MKRVISMVPSWTETLLECGVEVVGRTRFCIHPENRVQKIPIVGGTKDIDWQKVKALDADFLLLDQEENPLFMKSESPIPVVHTHIEKIADVPSELAKLELCLGNNVKISDLVGRWNEVIKRPISPRKWADLPGVEKWLTLPPTGQLPYVYMIWQNPWMAAGRATFIGSVLKHLGYECAPLGSEKKYPELDLRDFSSEKPVLLFSSEPFPFHKRAADLRSLPYPCAIVNGESFSWFGLRTLRFLEDS
jgi:ABC-type Fe3+-hydroxamate transport system substrate-binding protein